MYAWLEKGDVLPNYPPSVWPRSLSKGRSDSDNICLMKMEGQGHIFTFDLIVSESMCYAKVFRIQ